MGLIKKTMGADLETKIKEWLRTEITLETYTYYKGGTHRITDEFELSDDFIIHIPPIYDYPIIVHLLGKDMPDYIMFDFGEEKMELMTDKVAEQDLLNLLNHTSKNLRKFELIEYGCEDKINICAIYERFGNEWVKTSVCAKSKLSFTKYKYSKSLRKNIIGDIYGTY